MLSISLRGMEHFRGKKGHGSTVFVEVPNTFPNTKLEHRYKQLDPTKYATHLSSGDKGFRGFKKRPFLGNVFENSILGSQSKIIWKDCHVVRVRFALTLGDTCFRAFKKGGFSFFNVQFSFPKHILKWKDSQVYPIGSTSLFLWEFDHVRCHNQDSLMEIKKISSNNYLLIYLGKLTFVRMIYNIVLPMKLNFSFF